MMEEEEEISEEESSYYVTGYELTQENQEQFYENLGGDYYW